MRIKLLWLHGALLRARSPHTGRPVVRVLNLALPAVGEQVLNMAVGLTDTYLVGHLGAAAITAVSISNQVVMLANVLFSSVATGGTALIARCVGAEDLPTARRAANQCILVGAGIGLTTTILGTALAPQIVYAMGARGEALPLAATYLGVVSYTFLITTWMFVGMACLRGAGDTLSTMRVMMLVNGINVVVAAGLIYGPFGLPKLGVLGSAIGAACARAVGGFVVLGMLFRGRAGLRLRFRQMLPDPAMIRRLLRIGIPTGIEQLLFRLADMSFFRTIATLGTAACAAHSVAISAESLSYAPGFGFAVAATTLVGQGLGARDPKRAQKDGYLAYALGGAFMSLMGVVFYVFSPRIIAFFTSDPEVIALGMGPLRWVALAQPLLASTMIFSGALRGAGDTRFPMVTNGINVFVVRFGLAFLFVHFLGMGLMGAWYAMTIDITIRGILNGLRFRSGSWKRVQV